MIEKLTLKLRASEEMRLRLQMEKSDLRKQLMAATKGNSPLKHTLVAQVSPTTTLKHKHNTTLDYLTSPGTSKEVGEVEDSINSKETSLLVTVCCQCQGNLKVELQEPLHEGKHQEIQQENELLRQGMLEILEKLREYDDCSNQIIIDKELLSKLIQTLRTTNSTFDTPKRLREQLAVIRTREKALEKLLSKQTTHTPPRELPTEDLNSIESVREDGEIKEITTDYDIQLPAEYLDSSTRPTTPNKSLTIPCVPTPSPAALEKQQAEAEMCLSDKRTLKTELEELKIFKKYYEELKLHMHANEMEIMQTCAQLTEQIVHLEQDFIRERKSYEYMREDFNENLSMLKQQQIESIQIQAELKKELSKSQAVTEKLKQDFQTYKNRYNYRCDEYKALQQSLNESQMQLAIITEELLCGKQENSIKIPDLCLDYGIIKEDLQLEFITQEEYENQKQMINTFETQKLEMQRKTSQLETLLEIAQEQILSQQKLLNEITDTQVNLRHTVADLQSSTEDKLLIAKIQRDLDAAKLELGHVRNERDSLQIKFGNLEQELVTSKHLMENLNKNFHFECQNNNLKIRFLQKSLYYLKEKYAKFTPLVFLSNFAYAYQKFLKKKSTLSEENHTKICDLLNDDVMEIIKTAAKKHNMEIQENEQVIKLVKAETQCKLYEEQLKQWKKKCFDLEKDLQDIKLKMANETEHWRTIDALFEIEGKSLEKPAMQKPTINDQQFTTTNEKLLTQEIGCNTDNIPIPAERTRRVSKVMVDKNISPIQTPLKKHTFNDTTTQTDESETCLQTTQAEEQEKESEGDKSIVTRETSEAQIQTSRDLIPQDSKAIQTLQEQEEEEKNAKESPVIKVPQEKISKETPEKCVINKTNAEREAVEKLFKTEESLSQAKIKIQELEEKLIQQKQEIKSPPPPVASPAQQNQPTNLQSDVIEKTILSFHTLLTEKDKSISKYQDILQTEREENHFNLTKLHNEIEDLKITIVNLNFNIKTKDTEIFDLKTQLESVSVRRNSNEKLDLATHLMAGAEENIDNSLNEMTDEKIEEMFEENLTPSIKATEPSDDFQTTGKEKHELEHNKKEESNEDLFKQLKEFKEKSIYWESSFKLKEEEIQILKEKIKILQEREKSTNVITYNPEIDQLRSLLEEKDKHINELMDTLNNFHDDQQRYINDSSNYSADQIAKLASDLTRTEATNKIYQTQIEALRKQLTNLTQREKQARELNQSLRNQLIKRPIVSIKTELNARVKNENLQKKIQQLELDWEDAKAEIQRQKNIIDSRRARSANEVGLWEKQKRWQQNAEKFKTKLEETEIMLEKTRALLQSARNTINRLDKDKQILEAKLGRTSQQNVQHSMKCCRTPSCPNLQINQTSSVGSVTAAKYTPSETPETYTGASSECSSPGHGPLPICNKLHYNHVTSTLQNPQNDIIEALKARLEMQQRKIIALELEGKGSNVLTTEIEKIQEKLSSEEAQNIRLEAKNLQLQLDNDLLRQGDGTERLQKRIKHLEDYIIALKEEMASAEARKELCKCSGIKLSTQIGQSAETTILSLRNLVEKLQAENKYLKDVRKSCVSKTSTEISNNDSARFQQMYTDSQNKISALQLELKLQSKCPHCENKGSRQKALDTQTHDELKYVKEQLMKKSQLLQKAKVLLARAAAKEKVLKEQLAMWKRKCFELQNVPVIDEISE